MKHINWKEPQVVNKRKVWRQNILIILGVLVITIPILVVNWQGQPKARHQQMELEAATTFSETSDARGIWSQGDTEHALSWNTEPLVFYVNQVAVWRWDGLTWSPIEDE